VREDEDQLRSPQQVFNNHNGKIITALKGLGITRLSLKGISDIALEEKKILGSSLYRARGMVFFHAVLNVSQQPYIFERYLRHPPREPEYRRGRTHREFVTSLYAEGHELPMDRLKAAIEAALDSIPSL
jgi:lipoate-protein ligase A